MSEIEPQDLPAGRSAKGKVLVWRHTPLFAEDPVSAWQGVLEARGLRETDAYFSPRLADLPDPFLMVDMEKAATRIAAAIQHAEKIHIFGDFDADGVNGTAILLEALSAAGATVSYSIPHRADQGHGIGVQPVRMAVDDGAKLGLSVDTGTTCFDACDEAKKIGFDLIVSDHHLPDSTLPNAFALLNPARESCGFADRKLCGTGVAFFLLMAVWKKLAEQQLRPGFDLRLLLDRVAVATIADVMDLVGVNRVLVYHGLQKLNRDPSIGMKALMKIAKVKKAVTAETIGFYLAPRINAAGRLQHGEAAMRMLSTGDADEAAMLAAELDATNKERRKVEVEVLKQAELKLGDSDILAVYDDSWHAGVVGLVAGRLARKHGRPAAVGFVTPDGVVRVSLRGMPGFHIGKLLNACSEHLEGFGGHAGAGGGGIKPGQWHAFTKTFAACIENQSIDVSDHLRLEVDGILGLGCMHIALADRLARFEPIGRGNSACAWLIEGVHIADRRDLKGGVVRLKLTDGSRWIDGIVFGAGAISDDIQPGLTVSIIGQLQKDDYRGGAAVQFVIEDVISTAVDN
ncbi:single-stranded-DNA-specific exonuclease RecJ [Mariprofundus sp. EBB-1]|uniref:single-stranded-DNA-specific exonuclease RecJ n=1 Tax=Mariprofundus sp. EBB-1 TaxID=2650971 RepID=UPI000EF1F5A7|nr:single-stranded-DNA-specific exonuclease RecJ [Mariprofundus sp. EBB-1]RLL55973.1 single-stranded-DNA-specific exonuclease RecJ [Mariprofundus sp. EBB-1]